MPRALVLAAALLSASAAQAELRLFDQRSFQGRQLAIEREASNMNFSARSAKIVNGAWEVCPRPFFGGSCLLLDSDKPSLNLPRAFSGMIRSARPAQTSQRDNGREAPEPETSPDKPKSDD